MDGAFFMKVIQAIPMDEELRHSLVRNAQYTILTAQAPAPEKRIRLLVDRLKATSETNAPQYTCFLLNSFIEALSLPSTSSTEDLDPDFVEWVVENVLNEAKKRAKTWPYFIQWVCALIHYLCIDDDGTLCVFYELGAPHVALAALQSFPNVHSVVLGASTLLTHFSVFDVEGCVPALTNALHTYLEDLPVCLRATEALAGFTRYDKAFPDRYVDACERFVEAKGVEALTKVLQHHLLPPVGITCGTPSSEEDEETNHHGFSSKESGTMSNGCRFPEMLFYVACIAANVMNAGVLDDLPLTTTPPLAMNSTPVPADFSSFSPTLGDSTTMREGSMGKGTTNTSEHAKKGEGEEELGSRDDELYQGSRFDDDTLARRIIPGTREGANCTNEKFDPSTSKMVELLAAWLQPVYQVTDAYRIQVLQVLSNVPHSPFVDWECISSLFLSSESESVVLWCLHFLSSVAMNVKETKWKIYRTGCVPRVLEVMKTYSTNASIQEVACSLLSYLSFDSEVITECITKEEGIRLVLEAMKRFSTHEPLLLAACAALSGLTFHNQAGQVEISEYKGIGLILDALRIGRKTRLLENGCLAIGTMCWNTELKNEVVQLGGVEVVMKILEEHYTHPGVVKNTFRALAQIAFNCEKYRMELSTNGIIPLIIRGMEQHPQHDKVQMQGCVALSYLSWTNQGNAAQITAHRGYQVVIEAMRNHLNHHEVQEHAARALANITQVSQEDALAALDQIVVSMRRHERCAEVQEETCRAIVTLSLLTPANKDRLYELEAAQAVIAAMQHFPRHQLVQQEACNALAHLAYEHASLNRVVTELNGIDLLLTAMRTHLDSPKVQLNACGGLSAIAFDNPVAQRQIFELGGVQCVIRAMENFERPRMLELGCSALGTLAWNTEIKEQVAVEAVPEILKAMRVHEGSPLLQKSTCRAISQFAFNSEKNRHLLAEAGAIPLVVKAMRNHLSTDKLIVHAVKALTYLCWENVQVAEQIIHENIEEVLQQVVDHYSHSPRISGEAVHLSKILFRKTAGSLSPSIRVVSPPSSSPPLSMVPPTPYQGGQAGGRRVLRRLGGAGGGHGNNSSHSGIHLSLHHSPGGNASGTSPSPTQRSSGAEYSGNEDGKGGSMRRTTEQDGGNLSLHSSSSIGREMEDGNSGGGGGKSTYRMQVNYPPFSSHRWNAASRGGGRGGGRRGGGHTGTWSSSSTSAAGAGAAGSSSGAGGGGNGSSRGAPPPPPATSSSSSPPSSARSPSSPLSVAVEQKTTTTRTATTKSTAGGGTERGRPSSKGEAHRSPTMGSMAKSSTSGDGGRSPLSPNVSSHVDPHLSSSASRPSASFASTTSSGMPRGSRRGGGGGRKARVGGGVGEEEKEEDLWDDPSPETFYGNREVGEENWRQWELERQGVAS